MARITKHTRKVDVNNNTIKNITKWKQYILEKIIEDDELCKLLTYNSEDCLDLPAPTGEARHMLINNQVYGYRYIPTVAKEANSWISMSISNFVPQESFRQFSDDYLMGFLYFYILVDTAIMSTDTGYRQDLIASRIYEIFQGEKTFGVGEARMETMIENWEHNNKFGGYTLGFKVVEFK